MSSLTVLAASHSVLAVDARPGAQAPSPTDCAPVYAGAVARQTELARYQGDARIDCARPGNDAPYGPGSAFTAAADAGDGGPCLVYYYAPVVFRDLPAYILATWRSPSGDLRTARVDPWSNGGVVTAAGIAAATSDVFAMYARQGTFQDGRCQAQPRWTTFCREGANAPADEPCIFSRAHLITPATSPPPPVAPYVARVVGSLRAAAGSVESMPSPDGLVNLPTCFWIDGIAVPDERDFTIVLPGPPDPGGRRIYYTYLVRAFFSGVRWDFDDPFGNDQVQPHPACGQHPQITAHSYRMISEKRNADGMYHVTAREEYEVTVDVYWDDSYGPHRRAVDPGVPLPITISPPGPYPQYVGQVEAIPVSG